MYGFLSLVALGLSNCGVSKNTTSAASVNTIQLNTLTVKNLSEEVTQNDEIELHVFLLDQRKAVLFDKIILLEFTAVNQSRNIRFPVAVSGRTGQLHIALIEQDSEQDLSTQHHQQLKQTITKQTWKNTPEAELALSKQFGDDDLLGIKTITIDSNKKSTIPTSLTFEGSHIMDRFLYLLRISVVQ